MKQLLKDYKRIVIKIGASVLFSDVKQIDCGLINEITKQICALMKEGKEVTLVSSGAIALGMSSLRLESRPKQLSYLQAVAAIGQPELMDVYRRFFKQAGFNCAQVLLTWEDFSERKRYLNARNTLTTLLKLNIVPIINENDTVSTQEIKFGDNDRLSALVASLISADLLIMLSDVDGLLDKNKQLIRLVDEITPAIKELCDPTYKKTCVGGMLSKIEAAKIATDSGIPAVIANGRNKQIILSLIKGQENYGTWFIPKKALSARKHWIAFGTRPKGKILVDEGAKRALINKKSLLSVGVISCAGNFERGDIVSIQERDNCEFARGKVSVACRDLDKVKGKHYDKEIAHRDNIVIL